MQADASSPGPGDYKLKRPAACFTADDQPDMPTPVVDDCPTPMLAAMTGLQKMSISRLPGTPEKAGPGDREMSISAAFLSPRRTREKTRVGPRALPTPFILQPRDAEHHAGTIVMLHGFTSSGKQLASGWLPALARVLGRRALATLKLVFLNAPVRSVSCYGGERHPAWHDYYSDHGGEDGCPEVEEEIDAEQLAWSRGKVHEVLDAEATLLGGDYSRVAIGGASQGCCTALDAALTHPQLLGGVFASFGHVYSSTFEHAPYADGRSQLRIHAFHGAGDRCIAASLAMRTYAELADLGFENLRVHVEPKLTHCEPSDAESAVFAEALKAWGFVAPPPERGPLTDFTPPVTATQENRRVRARRGAAKGPPGWKQHRLRSRAREQGDRPETPERAHVAMEVISLL